MLASGMLYGAMGLVIGICIAKIIQSSAALRRLTAHETDFFNRLAWKNAKIINFPGN